MRPLLGALVGILLLGCGGLLGPPPIAVTGVRGGPCATVIAEVSSASAWRTERALPVSLDGQEQAPLVLPADSSTARLERPTAAGHHVLEVDGQRFEVEVAPADEAVDWAGWVRPPRQGDPAEVQLRVSGACQREALTLTAELPDAGRTLARRQALGDEATVLDVSGLPSGRHRLVVTLRRDELAVLERTFTLPIDPPCTGRACRDRDNDGFDGKASGGPDCDDTLAGVNPKATSFPDPDHDGAVVKVDLDYDCDGVVDHFDGPLDCAEGDPSVPRPEDPDPTGVDEDCDGVIDEGTVAYDDDGDGFSEEKGDCRDDDPSVSPKGREAPDCKDNDCDGKVDEGLTRATEEDAYEPDDQRAYALQGAQPLRNGIGGYRTTRDELELRARDGKDAEVFSVFAHDGALDDFHVTVELLSGGDGLSYEATITGPAGTGRGTLDHNGAEVSAPAMGFRNDSGVYEIRIVPTGEPPPQCPLRVAIDTG